MLGRSRPLAWHSLLRTHCLARANARSLLRQIPGARVAPDVRAIARFARNSVTLFTLYAIGLAPEFQDRINLPS